MFSSRSSVFCDWLRVTCKSDLSGGVTVGTFDNFPANCSVNDLVCFHHLLFLFCLTHGFSKISSIGNFITYSVGRGTLRLGFNKKFCSACLSGAAIRELERRGLWVDYLNIVGCVPHNVTRLDSSVDVYTDAPLILRSLEKQYPDDVFSFGRKSLKVTRIYSAREDDLVQTGSWYAGLGSKARVTAIVYDKQSEALSKRDEELPPTTRFELQFSKDFDCSLYDALNPTALFYSRASPNLLPLPSDYDEADWVSTVQTPWERDKGLIDKLCSPTISDFKRLLEKHSGLRDLALFASHFGESGLPVIERAFGKVLRGIISEDS